MKLRFWLLAEARFKPSDPAESCVSFRFAVFSFSFFFIYFSSRPVWNKVRFLFRNWIRPIYSVVRSSSACMHFFVFLGIWLCSMVHDLKSNHQFHGMEVISARVGNRLSRFVVEAEVQAMDLNLTKLGFI